MNSTVKRLWVRALRSGKYHKATGELRRENAFCCLGVLCDLYRLKTKKGSWEKKSSGWKFLGRGGALPIAVQKWAKLESRDPMILPLTMKDTGSITLSGLNDMGSPVYSFKDIAALIEKHL